MKNLTSFAPSVLRGGIPAILVIWLITPAIAQQSSAQPKGIPDDWSHHHLVFSNPGTFQDAMKNGTYDQWVRIVADPRFQQQQAKRKAAQWQATNSGEGSLDSMIGRLPPQNIKLLHTDWSMDMGSGAKVGGGQYPAIFSAFTQANCDSAAQPDFAVFNTGLAGSGTQPTIIAYDNLYSGCSGTEHPLVYFQYNTNGGTGTTSVVMANDGIQTAFIQAVGGVANLVILKSKRNAMGTNASLVTLTNTAANMYRGCTAPCMTEFALSGNPTVTYSAPYYDFANDVLYVGDDSGVLHKFQNIFVSATPGEITGGGTSSGWPQNISGAAGAADALTSPVFDSTSSNVIVNINGNTDFAGAKVARIPAAGGSNNIVISAQLGDPSGSGFYDGPLVDSSAARLYSFLDADVSADNAAVFQLTTTFASGSAGVEQTLGVGNLSTTRRAYDGNFDNIYFNSSNSTGNIYVCGRSSAGNSRPTLYQVPIVNNVMGAPTTGPTMTTAAADCSPVAEFFNSPTDRIFLSVTRRALTGSPTVCPVTSNTIGCILSFDVTSASGFGPSKTPSAIAPETGGTSGIVVDNNLSSPTGTSQVYFSPLADQSCAGNGSVGMGTGGCAVQAAQSNLQ